MCNRWRIFRIILSATLMVAVMAVIFSFSADTGEESVEKSDSIGEMILAFIGIEKPADVPASVVPIFLGFNIRKLAHIFIYACLGLTSYFFAGSLFALKREKKLLDVLFVALTALAISVIYSCFDELHQYFTGGRTATVYDVGIDAIGSSLSVALCGAVNFLLFKKFSLL